MPYRNQKLIDRSRMAWMRAAAQAVISATTADGRYVLLRQGFGAWERHARVSFRELAGFNFSSSDLRTIWEFIEAYVCTPRRFRSQGKTVMASERDWLWPKFKDQYEADLRKTSPTTPRDDDASPITLTDAHIVTENAQGRRSVH